MKYVLQKSVKAALSTAGTPLAMSLSRYMSAIDGVQPFKAVLLP